MSTQYNRYYNLLYRTLQYIQISEVQLFVVHLNIKFTVLCCTSRYCAYSILEYTQTLHVRCTGKGIRRKKSVNHRNCAINKTSFFLKNKTRLCSTQKKSKKKLIILFKLKRRLYIKQNILYIVNVLIFCVCTRLKKREFKGFRTCFKDPCDCEYRKLF